MLNFSSRRAKLSLSLGSVLVPGLVFLFVVRPWYLRWGATDTEVQKTLPGDEVIPNPDKQITRAITISAPVGEIWPWLLQLGQQKGGFYSYDWFENLIGCDIHSADRIVPEWQAAQVGDLVGMYPPDKQGPPPYIIAAIQPEQALIMGHKDEIGAWVDSWQFVLEPQSANVTRLILRSRSVGLNGPMWAMIEPGVFIMERGMLLGIKERVEGLGR